MLAKKQSEERSEKLNIAQTVLGAIRLRDVAARLKQAEWEGGGGGGGGCGGVCGGGESGGCVSAVRLAPLVVPERNTRPRQWYFIFFCLSLEDFTKPRADPRTPSTDPHKLMTVIV